MDVEVAYVLKGYPRLSETFISNEIYVLESMGLKLGIFSIKQSDENQVHGVVEKIQAPLRYLPAMTSLSTTFLGRWLWENLPAYYQAHLQLFKRRPGAYLRTVLAACWMGIRYRANLFAKPRKVFLKEFLQAGLIALEVLESRRIRHLHSHFCHGATTVAMFASELSGIPFSFTAHAKDIYQRDQNPGDLLQKKIDRALFVVTCTEANRHFLNRESGGGSIHKIYHGLDVEYFKPNSDPVPDNTAGLKMLSVGRFVEKKGFHYLIEACRQLKCGGYDFQLRLIGEKGDQYEPLLQLIRRQGLDDRVSLEAPVAHETLVSIYQQSDVFVLPCQVMENGDRDGIPNVLVEAMASGLAVLSTRISGIPELIEHEVNGLLVEEKDSAALGRALVRLYEDAGLRRRLAANARQKTCQQFDSSRTTQSLKHLFDGCLKPVVCTGV